MICGVALYMIAGGVVCGAVLHEADRAGLLAKASPFGSLALAVVASAAWPVALGMMIARRIGR